MLDDDKVDQSAATENPTGDIEGLQQETPLETEAPPARKTAARKATKRAPAKRTTKKVAASESDEPATAPDPTGESAGEAPAAEAVEEPAAAPTVKQTTRRRATKKVAAPPALEESGPVPAASPAAETGAPATEAETAAIEAPEAPARPARRTARKASARKTAATAAPDAPAVGEEPRTDQAPADQTHVEGTAAEEGSAPAPATVLFQAPVASKVTRRTRKSATPPAEPEPVEDETAPEAAEAGATAGAVEADAEEVTVGADAPDEAPEALEADETDESGETADEDEAEESADDAEGAGEGGPARRRRRRGGRRRRKAGEASSDSADGDEESAEDEADETTPEDSAETTGEGTSRRRRRRRRAGEEGAESAEEDSQTVTRVRSRRSAEDQITAVAGSTRLEAKKQRRREGREAGRRRAPIVSEAEFLARRESVERVMVVRQRGDLTQIAVLEDKVLVEHYVARESQTSLIGNVYLGRVQNVLPSMEAAFIDIGKGRNAVLYAGEVNWSALGHKEGQPRKIESVLSSGQSVLVQVTKDPVGHKGARLTSQISLAGRFLVYVPDGTTSGISRKLPDTERNRLKALLKEIVPDTAGVIVRTAAEGASEEELTRDVERLKARWEDIESKARGNAPQLLYGEPDLTLKVVRDLFTEDFSKLVIEGPDAWDTVQGYVAHVAPDLEDRLERFERGGNGKDVFAAYRIDEQIAKGLDRKVWLPSGGSLIIDRTEAMTVVDVNTGKFTGSGGNLEETVTKNNLEAAEEIVRQLRLRDIGGIIVIDFIDMVLESNRDLVVRRLVECLGRDRTRHQVAEVTSLGLVQMTRKRIGTGLLEAFSTDCEHCHGRGVIISESPVEPGRPDEEGRRGSGRRSRGRGKGRDGSESGGETGSPTPAPSPSPKDVAAMARAEGGNGRDRGPEATVPAEPPTSPATPALTEPEPPTAPATDRQEPSEPAPEPVVPGAGVAGASDGVIGIPAVSSALEPGTADLTPAEDRPRVVTRTRRRAASRPAGPPTGGVGGGHAATGLVEPGTADLEPGGAGAGDPATEHHVEHVPIKKKGSRKR